VNVPLSNYQIVHFGVVAGGSCYDVVGNGGEVEGRTRKKEKGIATK
jgi:hypothetical protein